jgi:hypothetical protein
MSSWGLTCKGCGQTFAYSKIRETLADYFLPAKPEMAPEGVERQCPNCNEKFVYTRNELTYYPPENT